MVVKPSWHWVRWAPALVLAGLLAAGALSNRPASAQVITSVLPYLEYALKALVGRIVEKGVDAIWSTEIQEVRDLKAELARFRRLLEHLGGPGKAAPTICPDQRPEAYVRCLVDRIKQARQKNQIDDKQAKDLARELLEILAAAERHPIPARAAATPVAAPPPVAPPSPPGTAGPGTVGPGTDSRQIGPDTYCSRTVRPDGSMSIGMIRAGNRDGDWFELAPGQASATLVAWRNGRAETSRTFAGKALRPDRKHEFSRRVLFAATDANQLANGFGLNVYESTTLPRRLTVYVGHYAGGRRQGPGCYFGTVTVFAYCYRRDLRLAVPQKAGYADLSQCAL